VTGPDSPFDFFDRTTGYEVQIPRTEEETLVTDDRAALTPSQHVEQKLIGILNSSSLMVSHVQRRLRPGPR
jgi:hypothetical protein